MNAQIQQGHPLNIIIETISPRKDHMRETDNIGALPEFDARSAASSLTSRSYAIRSTGGGKEALHVRTKSCTSIFGSILKSRKRQPEVRKTALEELLLKQISQLKADHNTQVHELHYKLQQRERSIQCCEEGLQTQQETLIQFQNEIQNLKDRLKDAEDRNHALKKASMQNSSRSINSSHSQIDDKSSRGRQQQTISEHISETPDERRRSFRSSRSGTGTTTTPDDVSHSSSTNLSHHSRKDEIMSCDSSSINTSSTRGETTETDKVHSNHRRSFNSTHNQKMKRRKGSSVSSTSRQRYSDDQKDAYHSSAYNNSDELSCDGSRASMRSRRSTDLRNSVRSQRCNSDLPDYKLYRGSLDEFEQNEKSKRLRQLSKMRAQAKAEQGQPLTSREKNGGKRATEKKTVQTTDGRRVTDIATENSVVSKNTENTAKTSEEVSYTS